MSLAQVSAAGVSVWLDDLSRERMIKGGKASFLPDLIRDDFVVGVTTNPAIFSAAIANSDLYRSDIDSLYRRGLNAESIITELTTADVKKACELFLPVFDRTEGVDGRVSIEVDPRLARDTSGTIKQAKELWSLVGSKNVLIKVPATVEGLPAIRTLTAEGISVNVTIIFSVSRYEAVLEAFILGLEDRISKGLPISDIHSVASFFISRVDTEIDGRLNVPDLEPLKGRAALANARLAYEHFLKVESSERWEKISSAGGNIQRPLWASTGVKDPKYQPTMYVMELIADKTVNTMPEATLNSVRASQDFNGETIMGRFDEARATMTELSSVGIEIEDVAEKLELEGIEKFIKPWNELIQVVERTKG
ncbi:MAG: transaldolase [Actinomycetota bacterium]|jgi:transaldolase